MPRSGENANECTEEIIPLLTINVPYKVNKKLSNDNAILQRIKRPLMILKWCNAIPASHGNNEIFSTR